nr:hypothetical protein [Myxococcus llanfairpwllgwyngyllgogerychwyrndrobwllllantysiliogogogochensis]
MAHGSVLAYIVQPARTSGVKRFVASRIRLDSAWPVQSRCVATVFSPSSSTCPWASTSTAPKGWSPRALARRAASMDC